MEWSRQKHPELAISFNLPPLSSESLYNLHFVFLNFTGFFFLFYLASNFQFDLPLVSNKKNKTKKKGKKKQQKKADCIIQKCKPIFTQWILLQSHKMA